MEVIAIYFENHTKPINKLCAYNAKLLIIKAVGASYRWDLKG
jgi:hypothetical protein